MLHSGVIVVLQSSAEGSRIVSHTWGISAELSSCRSLLLAKPANLKAVQMHQWKPHSHAGLQWVVIQTVGYFSLPCLSIIQVIPLFLLEEIKTNVCFNKYTLGMVCGFQGNQQALITDQCHA